MLILKFDSYTLLCPEQRPMKELLTIKYFLLKTVLTIMNYLKPILIIFIFLLINKNSISQPHTEWVQRYNSSGNYDDYVTDMAIDKSGNVYLTGYVNVTSTNQDFVTIKYNTQGTEQWVRYYDGPDHREDKPVAIAVDDSGNVVVSGSSYSNNSSYDYLTIKYNSQGDSLWVRRYQDGLTLSAIALDKEGNVYVTGNTIGDDILTLKYSNDGNLKWTKYFNGVVSGYDVSYGLNIDKNNIIYVIGGVTGKGGVIIKYDSSGNQLPLIIFPDFTPNKKIFLDDSLNIYLGFDSYGGLYTRYDIGVAKLDSNGILEWIRTYHNNSTNNNDYVRDMCLDRFGNVAVTGLSADLSHLGWDIATIKYKSNGDTLWIKRYNPSQNSNDEPSGIASDKYGNIYVTGASDSGLFAKMITIKYSSNGSQEWIAYYNNNNPFTWHSGVKVICDTLGNLYVGGRSLGNGGNGVDIVTIKYSMLTSYQNNASLIPQEFKLYQNYPNPFNPKTTIIYELPVESKVSIKVYNALGNEIKILVNEIQIAGKYESEFDGSNFPSGIYFYTLFADGLFIETKKLILLK